MFITKSLTSSQNDNDNCVALRSGSVSRVKTELNGPGPMVVADMLKS